MSRWPGVLQRYGAVLIWLIPLLLGPALDLLGGTGHEMLGWLLVAAMAVAVPLTAYGAGPPRQWGLTYTGAALLAAAVVGTIGLGSAWLPTWILLAITLPVALRGRWLSVAELATATGAAGAAEQAHTGVWTQIFVVTLAGLTTTAFLELSEANRELRRTRAELARAAVAEERERLARDLHDLLGHTLSVVVVKAEAVRRLAHRDPDAAVAHALDIETVGRDALGRVRDALDDLRRPTLADELVAAEQALAAAGIHTEVTVGRLAGEVVDDALAWVVREGTTNVLRHSGAEQCRIELWEDGDRWRLRITDDGAGRTAPDSDRDGGLTGLSTRLVSVGGRLDVEPGPPGFRLTAQVPR